MIVTPGLAALGDSARTAFLAAMLAVVLGVLVAWLATSASRRRRRHHRPAVPALPGVPAVQRSRLPEPFGPVPPLPAEGSQLTPYVNGSQTVKDPPVLDLDPDAIHLNRASYEELRQIEGIDPLRAAQILAYRRQHGEFATQDDLQRETGLELEGLEAAGGRRVVL